MRKPKKPLKDPNEKNAIQKFFGGKIPHYLAVFAFLFSSYNLFSFQFIKMRFNSLNEKRDERMKELVQKQVNDYFSQQFPNTTGPVLKKYIKKVNGNGSNS
jgi:hypothetical protein